MLWLRSFKGLIMPRKSSRKNIRFPLKKYKSREKVYQKLFQSFLDAQAGILAQELKDGCPCPVCGSFEHPRPGILPKGQVVDQEILDREKQKLDRLENDANTQSVEAGKRKERQKTLWHQIQREAQELLHETEWKKLIPLLKEKQDQCEKQLADSEEEIRIAIERKKNEERNRNVDRKAGNRDRSVTGREKSM